MSKLATILLNGIEYLGRKLRIEQRGSGDNRVYIDGNRIEISSSPKIDIVVHGDLESLEVGSATVDVKGSAGSIKTGSGDVKCGAVNGPVMTASGNVECGAVQGSITTASGDVDCHNVGGNIKTVSGDVRHSRG